LNRVAGRSPYPASDAVRYAVINERDRGLLVAAGVPESRVGLLRNPMPEEELADETAPPVDRERVAARLRDFADDHGYRFNPDGPILLYPIRAIRRKNVLEIATISRLVPNANLLVTLPGVSESERPYSELVRYAYEERRIHGLFGIGRREAEYALTYEEIAHACDLVVSSSVQEGFGLLFVNALRWRRPLLARRLDVLSGIDALFEDYPARLYDGFSVPVRSPTVTSMKAYLRMRYGERLAELEPVLPTAARERIETQLDEMLAGESIDFSYLPPQMQLTILGDVRDRGFGALVQALNPDVVSAAAALATQPPPSRSNELAALLGYRAYAKEIETLWESAVEQRATGTDEPHGREARSEVTGDARGRFEGVQEHLVAAFAGLAQVRLLLGPIDHSDH
ncbi:MAG: glycosyltransferase, partial [Spirochaetota bacterium]